MKEETKKVISELATVATIYYTIALPLTLGIYAFSYKNETLPRYRENQGELEKLTKQHKKQSTQRRKLEGEIEFLREKYKRKIKLLTNNLEIQHN